MQTVISQTFAISAEKPVVSVSHTDNYYLIEATGKTPSANDSRWQYVPVGGTAVMPTSALPYLWHKSITFLTDGTSLAPVIEFGGSLGKNGIDYDLVPSASSILKAEDGSRSPASVSCSLIKREADGTATNQSTIPAGYSITVIKDSTSSSYALGSLVSTANCSVISFILKYGSVNIERHDIRVIAEGAEGLAGRGIQSQDVRFKANADGIAPAAPVSDSEWNTWNALTSAGYSSEKKYLWRCTRTVYVDGNGVTDTTYVVDGPTVWGTDGQSAISIDLDNEKDAIPTDSTGKLLSAIVLETNVRIYKGGSLITSGIMAPAASSIRLASQTPTIIVSSGVINIKWPLSANTVFSANKYAVSIPVIYEGNTYNATYTASVVRSGQPGVSPVVYALIPSLSAINVQRNPDTGDITPSSISILCGYKKMDGANISVVEDFTSPIDGYHIYFRRHSRSSNNWQSLYYSYTSYKSLLTSFNVKTYDKLQFILCKNTSAYINNTNSDDANITGLIDRETVPVIADGSKGDSGSSAFVLDLDNEMDAVSVLASGIASASQSWTINVKAFYGSTQVTEAAGAVFTITEITGNAAGLISTNVNTENKIVGGTLIVSSSSGTWTKSGVVRITIQVSHATYGSRTAVFTLKPVFPGEDGKPVPVYQLLLSQTEAAFSRSNTNALTPASVKINCGYTKKDGAGFTSYPGTNVNNLWYKGGAPYNIFFRPVGKTGTYGSWAWMKDLLAANNYALVIPNTTSYAAYEFILSSATTMASIADENIIDRETLPIRIEAATGNGIKVDDFYCKLTPTIEPPSTTSLTTANGWYKRGTTGCPTAATQSNPYLWECEHIEYSDTTSLNKNVLRLLDTYNLSMQPNLLEQSAFDSENVMDKWEVKADEVIPQARGSYNAFGCWPNSSTYKEMLRQRLYVPGVFAKIQPNEWYTLSFFSRTRRMVNQTSKQYGFAIHEIYLKAGKYKLQINGHCSSAAMESTSPVALRGYLHGYFQSPGTGWNVSVAAIVSSKEDTTAISGTLNVTVEGIYHISFYAYKNSGVGGNDGETVTINWFRVISIDNGSQFFTFLFPSALIGGSTYFVDGLVKNGLGSDGNVSWTSPEDETNADSGGWTFHYVTFKTKSAITEVTQMLLFRIFNTYVEICQPKLEKAPMPTAWCEHEYDADTECSNNPRGEWKANTPYYFCEGVRDVVIATASTTGGTAFFRLKRRTAAAGYISSTQPYLDTEHWEKSNRLSFTATDLLLAKEGFIKNLLLNYAKARDANGNVTISIDGNTGELDAKGIIRTKAIYTVEGGYVTVNGKKMVDLVTNIGNSYVVPSGTAVYLPEPSAYEGITLTFVFMSNGVLAYEASDGIFMACYTGSTNENVTAFGMSVGAFHSLDGLETITIQAIKAYGSSDRVRWILTGQRGVLGIRSHVSSTDVYKILPDGQLLILGNL